MTEEKNIDASRLQNKFAEERLRDDELDKIAGGTGGNATDFEFVPESGPIDPTTYVSGPGGK